MADLLECPFCGGGASIFSIEPRLYRPSRNGKYAVACYNCGIYLGYDEDYGCKFDTEEEAIKAWNTRKPMESVVAELEALANYNGNAYLDCADVLEIVRGKE